LPEEEKKHEIIKTKWYKLQT